MFDDNFANAELLMRQTAMAALEQFMLILILMIAGLTALALLAALGGLLWQRAHEAAAAIETTVRRTSASTGNVVRLHRHNPNTFSPRTLL